MMIAGHFTQRGMGGGEPRSVPTPMSPAGSG
jgi:hypothetical protein